MLVHPNYQPRDKVIHKGDRQATIVAIKRAPTAKHPGVYLIATGPDCAYTVIGDTLQPAEGPAAS